MTRRALGHHHHSVWIKVEQDKFMTAPQALRSAKAWIIGVVAAAVLATPTLWWLNREANCRDLMQRPSFADSKIVRDKAGRCYACRDDGWLYDIAFETCPYPAKTA